MSAAACVAIADSEDFSEDFSGDFPGDFSGRLSVMGFSVVGVPVSPEDLNILDSKGCLSMVSVFLSSDGLCGGVC